MKPQEIARLAAILGIPALCINLQGCVAAAIPAFQVAHTAVIGYNGLKLYQTSSGGEVRVDFPDTSIAEDDKRLLFKLKRFAILANPVQGQTLSTFANEVKGTGLYDVVTPYEVDQTLSRTNDRLSPTMTDEEKRMFYAKVAEQTKAEAIFLMEAEGTRFEGNGFFSLKAPESSMTYTLEIYSPSLKRNIWKQRMKTVMTGNPANQEKSQREVQDFIAKSIKDKLLEVSGRKMS